MPWFSQHGYSTYAVSMRCHGASGGEHEGGNTLSTHTEDLGHLIRSLPAAPVLIGEPGSTTIPKPPKPEAWPP